MFSHLGQVSLLMTRATSVIASINCGRLNKIRSKMSRNEKKGTRGKTYSAQKVVRRSPPCRTGDDGLGTTNNIIILGDMNEDLLNPNMHKLKDVSLLKSLHNIISEPIRQLALLDPIKLHEDMAHLS